MKKYYPAAVFILAVIIIGYHYYAAGEAARQIDEALREQSEKSERLFTVSYSTVEVYPFSGDVQFQNFNLTRRNYIQTASVIRFDLTYLDFLNIYLGGMERGLKKMDRLNSTLVDPSIVFRDSAREFTADTLLVNYRGNMYDLLRMAVTGGPLQFDHRLEADALSFRFTEPGSGPGDIRTDSLYLQAALPAGATSFLNDRGHFMAETERFTWIPPQLIREKYGFFIRGFGYDTDRIPFERLLLMLNAPENGRSKIMHMNLDLRTELFHAQAVAGLLLNSPASASPRFENGIVNLIETSGRFDRFLNNAEQLFGITLPRKDERLLRFRGALTDLEISVENRDNR